LFPYTTLFRSPRGEPFGTTDPDVWRVLTAENAKTGVPGRFDQQFRIAHVVLDQRLDLGLALFGEDGRGALLHRVACPVELGAMAAAPELVERHAVALVILASDGFRNDDVSAADPGESAVLGERAELDRHVLRAFDLEDRPRNGRVLD